MLLSDLFNMCPAKYPPQKPMTSGGTCLLPPDKTPPERFPASENQLYLLVIVPAFRYFFCKGKETEEIHKEENMTCSHTGLLSST